MVEMGLEGFEGGHCGGMGSPCLKDSMEENTKMVVAEVDRGLQHWQSDRQVDDKEITK